MATCYNDKTRSKARDNVNDKVEDGGGPGGGQHPGGQHSLPEPGHQHQCVAPEASCHPNDEIENTFLKSK